MKIKKKDLILPPGNGSLWLLMEGVSRYLGPGHENSGLEVSVQFARVMASITGEINQLMAEGLWKPKLKRELPTDESSQMIRRRMRQELICLRDAVRSGEAERLLEEALRKTDEDV